MTDFFDHLFDPGLSGDKAREQARYRERLRSLILEAPPVRRLPLQKTPEIFYAISVHPGGDLPKNASPGHPYDLILHAVPDEGGVTHFRGWKEQKEGTPIWRSDPIQTEEQVLETRSMGADAYCLDVGSLRSASAPKTDPDPDAFESADDDLATLQFLVEVGRDFGLPAILLCRSAEDLALALRVQDAPYLWLLDELASAQLLTWDGLVGRILILPDMPGLELSSDWLCSLIIDSSLSLHDE